MNPDTDPVRAQALRLLDRRGYSRGELTERLVSKGHERDLTEVVIERLAECGLLDDEAYALRVAAMVLQKKPASASLIEQKLLARRVPAEIARRVAAEILADTDPVEAATRMVRQLLVGHVAVRLFPGPDGLCRLAGAALQRQ